MKRDSSNSDLEDPEVLVELLAKVREYNPEADLPRIRRAYFFAEERHAGQARVSGDPYITHPLAVASILANLSMDVDSICAGLLHDLLEDTNVNANDIRVQFGETVLRLVESVTKLTWTAEGLEAETDYARNRQEVHRAAENLRKILLAMARDIRVMVIKLADRLHNMETLGCLTPERQKKIASETMQIYAPLAARLGIWEIKWNLEDFGFKYLYPEDYARISAHVAKTRLERVKNVHEAIRTLKEKLEQAGIRADVQGRPKHLWSIYQKTLTQGISIDDIYDLTALRIIVAAEPECYYALGLVHDLWQPIPSLFYDYIAKPKANGYRSLHTKVMGQTNEPMEVQIRTWEMHRTAEFGIAAHWQYKEGGKLDETYVDKLGRLRQQLFDWSSDSKSSSEFLRTVVSDLFSDQVLVFTPKGDVIDLPAGATAVDLSYRIHTDLGNHTIGAKVNGRIVPLSYQFQNGDIVEILSRQNASPSADWMKFVKTSHARSSIRSHLRRIHRTTNAQLGRQAIEKELKWLGLEPKEFFGEDKLQRIVEELNKENVEDLLASVGEGLISTNSIVNRLRGLDHVQQPEPDPLSQLKSRSTLQVSAEGLEAMMLRRGRCCHPIPGEEVIGYVSRGRGIVIHRHICANAKNYMIKEPERMVPVNWRDRSEKVYDVPLRITTTDRQGLLADLSAIMAEAKVNISSARIRTFNKNSTALVEMTVDVADATQMSNILAKISSMGDVLEIKRVQAETKT
ncbi:MAG: bifunctional (p)ppGpp synthetase/guanosine-3',5'-bis(diphosphate) 3'-pyrophosphohydrolase [bacterium]